MWSADAAAGFRNPGLGGIETTFTHDPVSGGPHAVASRTTGGSTATYTYDAVGNMVGVTEGASSTTLAWDARNRLTSWSDGASTHSFSYDATGERVTSSDGTLTTVFLGDVEVGSDGTDRTLYRFAGALVAIRTTTGTSTTLELVITDHLGSPHVTFDPVSQAVSGSRLHRPYGATRDETGAMPGTVGYTGQHQDPSGLAYYGARYYSPELMVFISADTIVPDPSVPADLNRYGYVRGNPIKYTDPSGHCVSADCFAARVRHRRGTILFDAAAYPKYFWGDGTIRSDGRAATLHGSLQADHVAILLPGTGADIADYHGGTGVFADAAALFELMAEASVGVVAALVYDTPETLTDAGGGPSTASRLDVDSFIKSLDLSSGQRVTLVGHSFGTLFLIDAALNNADVIDAIVFLGSPGTGYRSASAQLARQQLAQLGIEVYEILEPDDPVRYVRPVVHGDNPDAVGAQRLPGDDGGGHSNYYEGRSMRALVGVILSGG